MIVSIETPVFKGGRLVRCIDSVLYQSSPHWSFSLLWDGGDAESRAILEELAGRDLPNVTVHFGENRGIAKARRFLTENSTGDFILPLDDDDALPAHAVERFLAVAEQKPWASVIRARRDMIDEEGRVLDAPAWFPFEPRHYEHGMVKDVMNHSQPYLIRRSAYDRTSGWEGFEDFSFAGEDCDIYLKLEERGTVELLDEVLYYYRVHPKRQSLVLTNEAAFEMWRRLADKTIDRIGLPLTRTNETPPYEYQPIPRDAPTLDAVDFLVTAAAGSAAVTDSLRRAGVLDDAVHRVEVQGPHSTNSVWQRTSRPLICFLDGAIDVGDRDGIMRLLQRMHRGAVDLASPRLVDESGRTAWGAPGFGDEWRPVSFGVGEASAVTGGDRTASAAWLSEHFAVVRREVLRAVGGFDEGFESAHLQMVDLSLRARQRQFACAFVGEVAFVSATAADVGVDASELDRLRRKWATYPELFA